MNSFAGQKSPEQKVSEQKKAGQGAAEQPSSASLGGRWQHRFFYLLLRHTGLKPAYFVLYFVAFWYTLYPGVRAKSRIYLEQRFGPANFFLTFWRNFRLNHNFAKVLLERAALGILGLEALKVVPALYENLIQDINVLLAEGRGLVLLTAHVGCWQWGLAGLGFVEQRANILQRRDQGDIDLHYFEHQQQNPLKIIDSGDEFGGVLEALNALKNNELVCIMGDRAYHPGQQLELDFLGRRASFPIGAYHLAAQAQAPVLILFILNNPAMEGRLEVQQAGVLRPVNLPRKRRLAGRGVARLESSQQEEHARVAHASRAGSEKNEMFRPEAERFVAALEQVCQKHPFQYFNFHNIWIE